MQFNKTMFISFTGILISINNVDPISSQIYNTLDIKAKEINYLSEKEINALMEEYKTAFPIKEKLQELYITSNYYKINKNTNDQITVNDENSENKVINAHQPHNSINSFFPTI